MKINRLGGRPFRDALIREIEEAEARGEGNELRAVARKMINMAKAGDQAMMFELLGRLDGRIPQPVDQNVNVEPITVVYTGVPRPGDDAKIVDVSAARSTIPYRKRQRQIPRRRPIDAAED